VPLPVTIAIGIGAAIANALVRHFAPSASFAGTRLNDFLFGKLHDVIMASEAERQIVRIGEQVATYLIPLFEQEGARLQPNQVRAVALAVASTLDHITADESLVPSANVDERALADRLLKDFQPRDVDHFSSDETALYERVIREACIYITRSASTLLSSYRELTDREVLARLDRDLRQGDEILRLVREIHAERTAQARLDLLTPQEVADRYLLPMGDPASATFTYLTEPLQAEYRAARDALLAANTGTGTGAKVGLVVYGYANAGKTRLALEALRAALPEWPVLVWTASSPLDHEPPAAALQGRDLVLFLDDLPYFVAASQSGLGERRADLADAASRVQTLVTSLRQRARRLVIVATCRTEARHRIMPRLGWLLAQLTEITIPLFRDEDPRLDPFKKGMTEQEASAFAKGEFDGTLGWFVLRLQRKHDQYAELRENAPFAYTILRAMKLLTRGGMREHTERLLRAVCADILGEDDLRSSIRPWLDGVEALESLGFVAQVHGVGLGGDTLTIRKDAFLEDQVVDDYLPEGAPAARLAELHKLERVLVRIGDAPALTSLGDAFFDLNRHGDAVDAYNQALALDEILAVAWFNKGAALSLDKRNEEALAAYERAAALDPNDGEALMRVAFILQELKRETEATAIFNEALVAIEQALARDPDDAASWALKGDALAMLGRWGEALAAYERAIELAPDNAVYWDDKGRAQSRLGRNEEALAAYERAIELAPGEARYHRARGVALGALGRNEEALAAYERAIELAPDNAVYWDDKGDALAMLGRWGEALAAYERAIELAPNNADMWASKARLLVDELAQYDGSISAAQRAVELDPNSVRNHSLLGEALFALGRKAEAEVADLKAIALQADDGVAWEYRGYALARLGRLLEALDAFEEGLTSDHSAAASFVDKGAALAALGRHEEALAAYERALALDTADRDTYHLKAASLRALSRVGESADAQAIASAMGQPTTIARFFLDRIEHRTSGLLTSQEAAKGARPARNAVILAWLLRVPLFVLVLATLGTSVQLVEIFGLGALLEPDRWLATSLGQIATSFSVYTTLVIAVSALLALASYPITNRLRSRRERTTVPTGHPDNQAN
jgi:tetratricopeptide (TPR) repeat protein